MPGRWRKLFLLALAALICGFFWEIWRAPLQGFYVALKFPLLIVMVTVGNALINSIFAKVMGVELTFRESFTAVLMSFTDAEFSKSLYLSMKRELRGGMLGFEG